MNLSAENIGAIRELVRSGYPLKARDAKDLLGHNDHLVELLEARGRLMLAVEIERDQLKDENEALRNSSSCVDDLSALVRQLVHRLKKSSPDNDLPEKVMDYLKRKGLQGSPLRSERDDSTELEAQKIYDSWSGQDGFVPWVKGGNSLKQDEARRLARAALVQGEQS